MYNFQNSIGLFNKQYIWVLLPSQIKILTAGDWEGILEGEVLAFWSMPLKKKIVNCHLV